MVPLAPSLLLIEWSGTDSDQIPARLKSGQLPALAQLTAEGRGQVLPPCDHPWPWPAQFAEWRTSGASVIDLGWQPLTGDQQIAPAELDDAPVAHFPASPDERALREHLAQLYSVHNAAIETVANHPPGVVAVRYRLIGEIATLYSASPRLSQALLAAHRLLDLLLHDLRAHADRRQALALTAPPRDYHPGLAVFAAANRRPDQLPRVPTTQLLAPALAQLAGLPPSTTGGDQPLDFTAKWLSPEIVPSQRWLSSPAIEPEASIAVRRGTARDLLVIRSRFPQVSWPASARLWVAEANNNYLLGALALTPAGGLALDWLPALDPRRERLALLQAGLAEAANLGLSDLFLSHLVSVGDARQLALSAHGFSPSTEHTLWQAEFPRALQRLAGAPDASIPLALRPPTCADLDWWRTQDVARGLIRTGATFDPDMSFAAELGAEPLGLVLAQRLGENVWADVACVTPRASAGGCFAPLMRATIHAWVAAGCTSVVFTTAGSGAMAAFARQSGAQVRQKGVRLHRA